MTDAEVEGFVSAGGEGLIWRVGMHKDIPMSITEAASAPVDVLLQAEVMADHLDRVEERLRVKRIHEDAHRTALRRMRGGHGR